MLTILLTLHIIAALSLVLIVLLQTGKGAAMGAAFGGSSQTVFGSAGAGSFLGKVTTGIAVLFMMTSLALSTASSKRATSSIVSKAGITDEIPAPTPIDSQPAEQEKQQEPMEHKN